MPFLPGAKPPTATPVGRYLRWVLILPWCWLGSELGGLHFHYCPVKQSWCLPGGEPAGGHLPQVLGLILTIDSPPDLKVWHVHAPSQPAASLYGPHFTSVASSRDAYNAAALFAPSEL